MKFILILLLLSAVLINANNNQDYDSYPDENILEVKRREECCPCSSNMQRTVFSSGPLESQQQDKTVHWDDKKAIKRPTYVYQERINPKYGRLDEVIKVIGRFGF